MCMTFICGCGTEFTPGVDKLVLMHTGVEKDVTHSFSRKEWDAIEHCLEMWKHKKQFWKQ